MSFDVGENILGQLLVLTNKTKLQCDGKVYKESRNLTLGEFVLSHVAVSELGLEQDSRSESILGMKIIYFIKAPDQSPDWGFINFDVF